MKSKILRVMAVGLTLAMVLSLTIVMGIPAAAGENEWSSPAKPASEGSDGDWLWDSTIADGPGPMAMAIDGTLYVYAETDDGCNLFKSDDGRAWDKTDYHKDVDGGVIVDIACSSLDADILYVADAAHVYKTDDGDNFETVGSMTLTDEVITSVDVGYLDDDSAFVFMGTTGIAGAGQVYYYDEEGYGAGWDSMDIGSSYNVYGLGVSPDFADDSLIAALVGSKVNNATFTVNSGTYTTVANAALDGGTISGTLTGTSGGLAGVFAATAGITIEVGTETELDTIDITGTITATTLEFSGTFDVVSGGVADSVIVTVANGTVAISAAGDITGTLNATVPAAITLTIDSGSVFNAVVATNEGDVGVWDYLTLDTAVIIDGSDPVFPADFDDDNYEMFVGVADGSGGGSVYRVDVDGGPTYRLGDEDTDINADVISLDILGDYSDTMLIAGTASGINNKVIVSLDDGDSWDDASKDPSGDGATWVVFDPDFADNGTAYVASESVNANGEGAVSLTLDEGDLYNQISMIDTDITSVDSLSFSRNWATDETWFLLTSATTGTDSLWRNDGDNWERVFVSTLETPTLGAIDKVQVSVQFPTDETVCVVQSGTDPTIYRSTDGGNDWDDLSNNPDDLYAWIVISGDNIVAGGDGEVYYTNNHGRRAWETEGVTGLGVSVAFNMSPNFGVDDTLLLGDDAGGIFISEDIGESWDMVGDDLETTAPTIVAFDIAYGSNGTIYAASGDEVNRCAIDTDDDWGDQEWKEFTTANTELDMVAASGLVCSADGTLYAADGISATETDGSVAAVGGVWRALNPTASLGDVVFELIGADDFDLDLDVNLSGLRLTYGSNILWSVDFGTADLWQYEDTLATEVVLDAPWSNSGLDDTDEVTLKWNELTGADNYELKYTDDPEWKEHTILVDLDETFKWVESLDAGTKYYWKVRVEQDEPLLSRWSKEWNFTTNLSKVVVPLAWEPENGAQGVIIQPSFGWTVVSGAATYEIELADNPDFTGATKATSSINSWVADTSLNYNTTYYWRVRALKDSLVISGWRSGAFTTMSEEAAAVEITPAPPAPQITVPAPQVILPAAVTPVWVWAIIGIGAALVIAVIVLIVRTRRAL